MVVSALTSFGVARLLMALPSLAMAFWLSKRAFDSGTPLDLKVSLLGTLHLKIGKTVTAETAEVGIRDSKIPEENQMTL